MRPALSPTLWMITRDKYNTDTEDPSPMICTLEVVQEGFKKATEAKAYKEQLNEPGLKIIPYYE